MEDGFVGYLCLAVGLGVGNGAELSLAPQDAEVVSELSGIELSAIIENNGARNAEETDDVPPYETSYFGCSYGGDGFGLYPLGEVIDRHKEILALSCCFRKRSKDVHTPSS